MSDGSLKGKTFGKWKVIRDLERDDCSVLRKVFCQCSCGVRRMVTVRDLLEGRSTYCGRSSKHPERSS